MKALVENRYTFIFLLMLFLSVPFLGRGLYESSEGRYARVAQTMVEENDFWMPKLNGHPHLTKPPLTYWVIALGMNLAGKTTAGARFLHTLAWIITALIVVRIGSELGTPRLGFLSGLVFATGLLPALGAWSLTTDPLLVFFVAFSLLALIRYEKEKGLGNALVFWSMVGFSLLTKGPVALIAFPFLSLRWGKTLRELLRTQLWIVSLLIGAGWYISLELKTPGILRALIRDELILRSTTDVSGRNAFWWAPLVVYLVPVLIGWGAWPFLIGKDRFSHMLGLPKSSWQKTMVIWIVGCLIFFSLVQSRLTLYILPLCIPASLLLADLIQENHLHLQTAAINVLLIFALKSYGTFFHHSADDSSQLTTFARPHIGTKKLNLLWEKSLFGVEFYLPRQFRKVKDAFQGPEWEKGPAWVLYQKKRNDYFQIFLRKRRLQVRQVHTFEKWNLAEVVDR